MHIHPPATPQTKPSAEYRAELNEKPVFVHALTGFAGGTVAWISFDFDPQVEGPVTLRITAQRNIDRAELRPRSAGVPVELLGNTAEVRITKPGHYFLKTDDAFQLPLYIFAHPPQEHVYAGGETVINYAGIGEPMTARAASNQGLIYFGPGVHRLDKPIQLLSGQTLYLAAGAEVWGSIKARNASDIRICGRGTLRGSAIPFAGTSEHRKMIDLEYCRRVVVEGILILDGFGWNVIAHRCEDVRFAWLKVLTERLYSTDGINPCSSQRIIVEDCFIRSKDDCVSVKGLDWEHPDPRDWRPLTDVTVRRCVCWSENNNAFVVGGETRASVIERIRFEDCDILFVSNTCGDDAGALAIVALDDTTIRDITFERIRVEWSLGPLVNVFFTRNVFGIPDRRLPTGGVIRDVTFADISLEDGPSRRSYLRGLDGDRRIENVRFTRLNLRGRPAMAAEDLRLEVNSHVGEVHWSAEVSPQNFSPVGARGGVPTG